MLAVMLHSPETSDSPKSFNHPDPSAQRHGREVHLDEWVAPELADESGYLRAGKLLEWMDVVGVLAATRHCGRPVVTASVDGMELASPIRVGERVMMTAVVAYTSARSIGVAISVRHGSNAPIVGATMTFVAVDDDGRVMPVPQFLPESPAELARFREGAIRREFRKKLTDRGGAPVPPSTSGEDAILLMREWLKIIPRLRMPWDRGSLRPRARNVSYMHKIEPIRLGKLNFHGTLYGGTLMRWLESSASLSARAYLSGRTVRLVNLDGLTFIRPAPRDVFVHIRSVVVHVDARRVTVLVNVHAEDPVGGTNVEVLRAFLSYAPLDADARIPPVECTGEEEVALFEEVQRRQGLQRSLTESRASDSKGS